MRLGLVSYLVAAEWDLPKTIQMCEKHGFQGVELRTTHRHGVEPSLSSAARREVRKRFADSSVTLWGIGTVCEFHAKDAAEVQRNVELARQSIELARDVGAAGIKVRPNGLQTRAGVPEDRTLEQIARAFAEVGKCGAEHGVEVWMEVHGPETSAPHRIRRILELAAEPNCFACWNSNNTDQAADGTIDESFGMLAPYIRSCHINELTSTYPYRRLFELLRGCGFGDRFTLAEVGGTTDPDRFLPYYRALWEELAQEGSRAAVRRPAVPVRVDRV